MEKSKKTPHCARNTARRQKNQRQNVNKIYNAYEKTRWLKPLITVSAAFILTYLVARNVFSQPLVLGDTPWVNHQSPNIIVQYIFNMWTPAAYGDNTPKPQSYIMLYLFAKTAATLQNMAIYNLLMHTSLPLSFLTFYYYSRKFCNNTWARILGATLYLINPVTIALFIAGQLMWILVFLPLSMNYFIDLLEEQKIQNTLKTTMFTSLTIWALPSIAFILFLSLIVTTLTYVALAKNKKDYAKKLLTQLAIYCLLLILCFAPYIYSTISYIQSPNFSVGSSVLLDFQYTYHEATIPNLLRLAGNGGSPQIQLDYNSSSNLSNEAGYIIPLFALLSLLWIKSSDKKRRIIATLTLLCFALLSATFLRFASNSELKWIITDIMLTWTLRNPFKIQILILVAVTPLFAFTVEKISLSSMKFLQQKNFKMAIITIILIFLAVSHIYLYNSFAFNGYMGIDKYPGTDQATPDETLTQIVNDSLTWGDSANFRGIILPFDHKTELYVEYSNMFLYPSRLGQNSNIANMISNALSEGVNFENLLRLLSVKYVYINNKWEDTGFFIIQPQNPQSILAALNKTGEAAKASEYSKIVLENALPTIYVSQYPILYSDTQTINLLDASTFQNKPVFIEIQKQGYNITTDEGEASKTVYYTLDNLYPNTYNLYAAIYCEKPETSLYYRLDNGELKEKTILDEQNPLKNIAQLQLQSENYNISLTVNDIFMFTNLSYSFINYGNGTYNITGQSLKIENGTLIGLKEIRDFDLSLKFKVTNYGEEAWHAPYVYFAFTDDSYFYAIFHENGYIELAKYAHGTHQSSLVLKKTEANFTDWNNLQIVKVNETITLYLNNQYMFSFNDPLLSKTGKIGLGSCNSTTTFDEVAIAQTVIKGICLIPTQNPKTYTAKTLEQTPGRYALQINNTENSWLTLFLSENYDPLWEATMNGTKIENHIKANDYGNLWIFNAPQGLLNIETSYNPNITYKYLFSISIITETATIIAAYLPSKILQKTHPLPRRKTKVDKGDKK